MIEQAVNDALPLLSQRLVVPLPASGHDRDRAKAALEDAFFIVADVTGWDLDKAADWPRVGRMVVLGAAKRAWQNPEGLKYEQIGAYAYTRDSSGSSSSVWLTDAEMRYLQKISGRYSVGSVGVVRAREPRWLRQRRAV